MGLDEIDIKRLTIGVKTKLYIFCNICKSSILRTPYSAITGWASCGVCSNKVIVKGINDIKTTNPEVLKYLVNSEDAVKYSRGNNIKVSVKCPVCGKEQKNKKILTSLVDKFSCEFCGDKRPYPEKIMLNILNDLGIQYEYQKAFWWSKATQNESLKNNKIYDFYLTDKNTIIEVHGGQHYFNNGFGTCGGRSLEQEKVNDEQKKSLAFANGISEYIVIDCRYSELEWVKNSIQKSMLSQILDINKVNWKKCHSSAQNSIIYEVSKYWNEGHKNTKEIAALFNTTSNSIVRYLTKGTQLGWCDYDPSKSVVLSCGKKVINIDTGAIYDSALQASRSYKKSRNDVRNVINQPGKYAGGCRWMYFDDYNNNKPLREKMIMTVDNGNKKSVICINTCETFSTVILAQKKYSIGHISRCCQGKNLYTGKDRKTEEKLRWLYLDDYNYLIGNGFDINDWISINKYLRNKYY